MNPKTLPPQLIGLMSVLLLAVACGAAAPATAPEIGAKTWNLVVLGGGKSWGVGKLYAADIEADERVKVTLHDLAREVDGTSQMLDDLRTFDVYRKAVKDAEVIIFEASALDYTGAGFFEEGSRFECSSKAMDSYKADLDAIIAEIFALRKGKLTLIRAMDLYSSSNGDWKKWGKYEEYKRCWEAMSATIHQVAAERKIPVAEVYTAFNGPSHDEEPMDKGYIQPDGEHPSEAGARVIAEAFRKLGYVPSVL